MAVINEAVCTGCGTCVATCPCNAITQFGFTDEAGEVRDPGPARTTAGACRRLTGGSLWPRLWLRPTQSQETPGTWEPRIIGFLCYWCSYTGADSAGTARMKYPANVDIIKVMCSGRIDPELITTAFANGADGVMVLRLPHRRLPLHLRQPQDHGPHAADATGPRGPRASSRSASAHEWVSAAEGEKFSKLVAEITEQVRRARSAQLAATHARARRRARSGPAGRGESDMSDEAERQTNGKLKIGDVLGRRAAAAATSRCWRSVPASARPDRDRRRGVLAVCGRLQVRRRRQLPRRVHRCLLLQRRRAEQRAGGGRPAAPEEEQDPDRLRRLRGRAAASRRWPTSRAASEIYDVVYHHNPSIDNRDGVEPQPSVETACRGARDSRASIPQVLRLQDVVHVDYEIPGCPPQADRVWEVHPGGRRRRGPAAQRGGQGRLHGKDRLRRVPAREEAGEDQGLQAPPPGPAGARLVPAGAGHPLHGAGDPQRLRGARASRPTCPAAAATARRQTPRTRGTAMIGALGSPRSMPRPRSGPRAWSAQIVDPVGTFYRFTMSSSSHEGGGM